MEGEKHMENIIFLIQNFGVSVVVAGACMWYVYHREKANDDKVSAITTAHADEITNLREQHKEDLDKMTEAITNNTAVIAELTGYLKGKNEVN